MVGTKSVRPSGVPEAKDAEKNVDTHPADDLTKWRLRNDRGRQTWHFLSTPEEEKAWPQTVADKHHLALPLNLPVLPTPTTASAAARNALTHFSHFQLPPGNWACEYGGPMFLLPGVVVAWYVTGTTIPASIGSQMMRYLFARQHPQDGGWGLHTEGESTVFGTAMNYVVLRILGVGAEEPRMVRARAKLHALGGAVNGPHWAKMWLSVLGVMEWDAVNPVPPELWLLPDWVPFAPWRWWIHMRQVFLPMSYIWSKKFSHPLNALTGQLREELYTQPYSSIDFKAHRNSIAPVDNYHPKGVLLNAINWALVNVWNPWVRPASIVKWAEDWTFELIECEDKNSDFADLAPVNAPMNLLACYIHDGPDGYSVRRHRERMPEFLWMTNQGMLVNGTNGVQTWDTALLIQAAVEAGLAEDSAFRPAITKALEFLDDQQMREDCQERDACYRQRRNGAWSFSTREQGYTVSDCTSEALKAVLLLQKTSGYPQLVSAARVHDAIDTLLTMQNASGGFSSYEPTRGSVLLEHLNAAEVFGRIMIEYDYPECTTAAVTALSLFKSIDPAYRAADIARVQAGALGYIRRAQRADGSWYGSWGICFTYAGMFALEALASVGETWATSAQVRRACDFLLSKQMPDGGWGESYRSCETGVYVPHRDSQVVQTCWALLGLMEAGCGDRAAVERGVRLVMRRQQGEGGWAQEAMEGVFNKSCTITYPNYRWIFSIKTLGMFAKKYGDPELL